MFCLFIMGLMMVDDGGCWWWLLLVIHGFLVVDDGFNDDLRWWMMLEMMVLLGLMLMTRVPMTNDDVCNDGWWRCFLLMVNSGCDAALKTLKDIWFVLIGDGSWWWWNDAYWCCFLQQRLTMKNINRQKRFNDGQCRWKNATDGGWWLEIVNDGSYK